MVVLGFLHLPKNKLNYSHMEANNIILNNKNGLQRRWMKGLVMEIMMVMMKIYARASKIWATVVMNALQWIRLKIFSRGEVLVSFGFPCLQSLFR
jgi:hypothetical protein